MSKIDKKMSFRIIIIPSELLTSLPYYCHSFRIIVIPNFVIQTSFHNTSHTWRVRKLAGRAGNICECSIMFKKDFKPCKSHEKNQCLVFSLSSIDLNWIFGRTFSWFQISMWMWNCKIFDASFFSEFALKIISQKIQILSCSLDYQ